MKERRFKNLKHYLISSIVTFAIGVGLFCLFFFTRGKTVGYGLVNWQDATLITGIIIVCAAGLMGVSHEGFFDIFSYGFKQLGGALFSKTPTQYNDYPGYRDYKKQIRVKAPKTFIAVLIVGLIFLIVSFSIYLAYASMPK